MRTKDKVFMNHTVMDGLLSRAGGDARASRDQAPVAALQNARVAAKAGYCPAAVFAFFGWMIAVTRPSRLDGLAPGAAVTRYCSVLPS